MTSKEIISDLLRCGTQSLNVSLDYIGARMCEARLRNGCRVNDASDAKAFLHECAQEVQIHSGVPRLSLIQEPPARRGYNVDFCPDCGHVHIDDHECGFPIGGGRVCRCERQVTA
jgi:hypothetical protein